MEGMQWASGRASTTAEHNVKFELKFVSRTENDMCADGGLRSVALCLSSIRHLIVICLSCGRHPFVIRLSLFHIVLRTCPADICRPGVAFKRMFPYALIAPTVAATGAGLKSAGLAQMSVDEFWLVIAFILFMGADGTGDSRATYWGGETDRLGGSKANFKPFMDLKRFENLMTHWTWMDLASSADECGLASAESSDKFVAIRPLVDQFNIFMAATFSPGMFLVVDESMVSWMGRNMPGWIYLKRKPKPGLCCEGLSFDCHPSVIHLSSGC